MFINRFIAVAVHKAFLLKILIFTPKKNKCDYIALNWSVFIIIVECSDGWVERLFDSLVLENESQDTSQEVDPDYVPESPNENFNDDSSETSEVYAPILEETSLQSDVDPTTPRIIPDKPVSSANSDYELIVQPSNNEKWKRVWDKVHYCLFCGTSSTNLTKHFFGPHKGESEVQNVIGMPVNSTERKLALLKLRNAGDYKHNVDALKTGKGTIVTWSRKSTEERPSDYLPCEDCLGFFLKGGLWRHRAVCPLRKEKGSKYGRVQSSAALMLPSSVKVSEGLKNKVLKRMTCDDITLAVRNDRIIMRIGEKLFQRHGHLPHKLCFHTSVKR